MALTQPFTVLSDHEGLAMPPAKTSQRQALRDVKQLPYSNSRFEAKAKEKIRKQRAGNVRSAARVELFAPEYYWETEMKNSLKQSPLKQSPSPQSAQKPAPAASELPSSSSGQTQGEGEIIFSPSTRLSDRRPSEPPSVCAPASARRRPSPPQSCSRPRLPSCPRCP